MVSIALTTYNGEKFLRKQLLSICNQTVIPDEIIVCDDISTDSTINILNEFQLKYSNIKWKIIINEEKLGFANNFRKSINNCSGDFIFLSDHDDIWDKYKIEKMLKIMNNNKNINLLFSAYTFIDKDDKKITSKKYKYNNSIILYTKLLFTKVVKISLKQLLKTLSIPGMSMCIRRNSPILKDFNNVFSKNLYCHDAVLVLIAANYSSLYLYNESLVNYRLHSSNTIGVNDVLEHKKADRLLWLKNILDGSMKIKQCIKDLQYKNALDEINDEINFTNYRINCIENKKLPNIFYFYKYNSLPAMISDILYILHL